MATINIVQSYTIQDGDKERFAVAFYNQFDDTTTIASLVTALQNFGLLVQAICDGAIVKNRIIIAAPLGAYTDPATVASGVEIERTGLFNFPIVSDPGKSWSYDIPAFAVAKFIGNQIDLTDSDVIAFTNEVTVDYLDSHWITGGLGAVTSGEKTFRKHRRQTKRK